MNDLFHRAADEARPIWLRMCTRVAASSHVAADETTIAMRGESTKAYVWTFLTDALTLYVFATGRSGATPPAREAAPPSQSCRAALVRLRS